VLHDWLIRGRTPTRTDGPTNIRAHAVEGCSMTTDTNLHEAGKIPASPEPDFSVISNDELVDYVISAFQTIRESLPYIQELRRRFAALPRGHADIAGCATWEEFCKKRLHRTSSAIRKALAEVAPQKAEPKPGTPEHERRQRELLREAKVDSLAKSLAPFITASAGKDGYSITVQTSNERELTNFVERVRGTYPESGTERQSLLKQISEELFTEHVDTRRIRFERFIKQLERELKLPPAQGAA
jgi:hypothetical protein